MNKKVSKIEVKENLSFSLREVVNKQGGWNAFVKEGESVLLKPNFNTADDYPGSTDVRFLKEVILQILESNPEKIYIGASSTMMAKTETVLLKKGVYDLEKIDKKVKVINFDKGEWIKKKIPQGKYLKSVSIPKIVEKVDRLILLPCLKTHFLAQYTGALKLSVGMMKPSERLLLHAKHIQEKIADLNTVFNPDLIVMDARTCFIDKGPMNGPREHPNLLLTSTSRVSIDKEGVKIIKQYKDNSLENFVPEDLSQIKRALELKIN